MEINEPTVEPTLTVDGLATYWLGQGEPLLLMPYPHASARALATETKLAALKENVDDNSTDL